MHIHTRNINSAFRELVGIFNGHYDPMNPHNKTRPVRRPSRNGPVIVIDEPVTITYSHPLERVLFNQARDANPTALLFEALYMLAGRNDVASLSYYTKQFAQYSDDGVTLNGAYGYRWRKATVPQYNDDWVDQLDLLVTHLRADPTSRRAVLSMWSVENDLLKIGPSEGMSKDTCCNLCVKFRVREIPYDAPVGIPDNGTRALDMTVFNRSNDLIWGALGANYVTFSVLQEYMAARLGVGVGRYNQVSDDLHVYTETNSGFKPAEWLNEHEEMHDRYRSIEDGSELNRVPLVRDPAAFGRELPGWVETYGGEHFRTDGGCEYPQEVWTEPFLQAAGLMMLAYRDHKQGRHENKYRLLEMVAADDWRTAAEAWFRRRDKK